jgi:CspA family cold shock protein
MTEKRETGRVKNYLSDKGYGFIEWRGGKDVYVHRSEVQRAGVDALSQGDKVSFVATKGDRGFQATQLEIIAQAFQFGPGYLAEGYFEEKGGKMYLRPELLDTLAMEVSKVLGKQGMKSNQLRRFFTRTRGIERTLDRDRDFATTTLDLYALKRDVFYQVGRKLVPNEFQMFIERNVELAVQDEHSFRKGFLPHFESVLAYFVYFFRD